MSCTAAMPTVLLLLVHGFGADERDLGALLPYLDPDGHFLTVLPRGRSRHRPGFAWYDFGADLRRERRHRLLCFARRARRPARRHLPPARHAAKQAIVAGFSQGAASSPRWHFASSDRGRPGRRARHERVSRPSTRDSTSTGTPRRRVAGPRPARHGGSADTGERTAASWRRTLEAHDVPVVYSEYPMASPGRGRRRAGGQQVARRDPAGERPAEPAPEDPPEGLVKPVTTASVRAEVLEQRHAR